MSYAKVRTISEPAYVVNGDEQMITYTNAHIQLIIKLDGLSGEEIDMAKSILDKAKEMRLP